MLGRRAPRSLWVFCMTAVLLSARSPLFAFNPVSQVTMLAVVQLTQPAPPPPPGLPHMVSPVTSGIDGLSDIFQVGGLTSLTPVSLSQPFMGPHTGGDTFQVVLSYKTAFSSVVSTMTVTGLDHPFQFLFNFPRSVIANAGGTVYYRLDSTDLNTTKTISLPSSDPTQYYSVPVNASMQAYIPSSGGDATFPTGILNSNGLGYLNDDVSFPAEDGPLTVTITPLSLLGSFSNLVPPTANNRYALGSLYPQVYSVTTVPDRPSLPYPAKFSFWYATSALSAAVASPSFGVSPSAESSLQFFTYDPVRGEWRPAASTQDVLNHTFSTQVMYTGSSSPSLFGIFPSVAIAPQDFRPAQRIITPNGDGINDTLDFGNLGSDATIDIYDIRGRRVRHLAGAFSWDGRDDSGNIVPSGVYIYQYELNGQRVSGVVAVAK